MKKIIAIVVAAALVAGIAYLVVWLNETEYTGVCSFSIAGESCDLGLAEINRIEMNGETIYTALFSEGGDSFRIVFSIWMEDGECWIDVDNPTIQIDGVQYYMPRPLGSRDISFDASDDWLTISFRQVPFNDGNMLSGSMHLMVSGGKLC